MSMTVLETQNVLRLTRKIVLATGTVMSTLTEAIDKADTRITELLSEFNEAADPDSTTEG